LAAAARDALRVSAANIHDSKLFAPLFNTNPAVRGWPGQLRRPPAQTSRTPPRTTATPAAAATSHRSSWNGADDRRLRRSSRVMCRRVRFSRRLRQCAARSTHTRTGTPLAHPKHRGTEPGHDVAPGPLPAQTSKPEEAQRSPAMPENTPVRRRLPVPLTRRRPAGTRRSEMTPRGRPLSPARLAQPLPPTLRTSHLPDPPRPTPQPESSST
jgi:hypothetical protein